MNRNNEVNIDLLSVYSKNEKRDDKNQKFSEERKKEIEMKWEKPPNRYRGEDQKYFHLSGVSYDG